MAGTGAQTGSSARWGDYSNMAIDPVDDCTFWFTTEYIATTGAAPWETRIGAFRFPSCTPTQSPFLTAAGRTTSDAAAGNNNGVIEPGETIQLNFGLNNVGAITATSVSGLVSTVSAGASMLNNSSGYANIAPGAVVTNTTPYTFAVSPQRTCDQPLTLALAATYNLTHNYYYTFTVSTGTPASPQNYQNFDSVIVPALPAGWTSAASGVGNGWATTTSSSDSAPNNVFASDPSNIGESTLTTAVFTPSRVPPRSHSATTICSKAALTAACWRSRSVQVASSPIS